MLNKAGLMPHSPLERLKIDEWDRIIDVNIKGVLYGIAAALPYMKQQKSGHIINVCSLAAIRSHPPERFIAQPRMPYERFLPSRSRGQSPSP
jgi:NADP-dependent 3-hydroxy acid dehydrogenase YdfG